jgi:hypothetical protein
LMRRFHVPLAMMPCPLILVPTNCTRLKTPGHKWVFLIIGPATGQLCVSQSPALANLVCALRLVQATAGSR